VASRFSHGHTSVPPKYTTFNNFGTIGTICGTADSN